MFPLLPPKTESCGSTPAPSQLRFNSTAPWCLELQSTGPPAGGFADARMRLLGLTGGVGMGKSTCAQLLLARGIPVIDTDDLAREVVEPGQPALAEIRQFSGPEIIDANGRLRRDVLARRVFADPQD